MHLSSLYSQDHYAISFYSCQKVVTKGNSKEQLKKMLTKGIININKPEKYSTNRLLLLFTSKENTGTKPQNQK